MRQKGDTLAIYYDPFTEKEIEGYATAVEFIESYGDGLQLWVVKFGNNSNKMPGSRMIVERLIKEEDKKWMQ